MKKIGPSEIIQFVPSSEAACVSLYANSLSELTELYEQAAELAARDTDKKKVSRIMRPIKALLRSDDIRTMEFPVAVFAAKGFSGYLRLPFGTRPLAVVARSFHIKPLLKWQQREQRYSVLRFVRNEALLYRGNLAGIQSVERFSIFRLGRIEGEFLLLEKLISRALKTEATPLILAGDPWAVEAYQALSQSKNLVEETIAEEDRFETDSGLHEAAIDILEPYLERRESALVGRYWSAERTGQSLTVLSEIIRFAIKKEIKHLFVNEKMNLWGEINNKTGSFTYSPRQVTSKDDDILDDLAELVLRGRGTVTVLPSDKMPYGYAACAIIRGPLSLGLRYRKYADQNLTDNNVAI